MIWSILNHFVSKLSLKCTRWAHSSVSLHLSLLDSLICSRKHHFLPCLFCNLTKTILFCQFVGLKRFHKLMETPPHHVVCFPFKNIQMDGAAEARYAGWCCFSQGTALEIVLQYSCLKPIWLSLKYASCLICCRTSWWIWLEMCDVFPSLLCIFCPHLSASHHCVWMFHYVLNVSLCLFAAPPLGLSFVCTCLISLRSSHANEC